jgi:hypothetical protein
MTDMTRTATQADPWKCPSCGNWLAWDPGRGALYCRSCRNVVAVDRSPEVPSHAFRVDHPPAGQAGHATTITCRGCGARIEVNPPVIAGRCRYCRAPFVAVTESGVDPVPDGVVVAQFDFDRAQAAVDEWVATRRFVPRDFKGEKNRPEVRLSYQPYWAFDTDTMTSYQGQRAEAVASPGSGVPTVRLHPAGGTVRRKFTNVGATAGGVVLESAVWNFSAAERYSDEYLVGATAVGATISLAQGWHDAIRTMTPLIEADIRATDQEVGEIHTAYRGSVYRYLLAPEWYGSYEFHGQRYRIDINAETGAVMGEKPWGMGSI